ncbi:MAG TPA: hypothetical protein VNN18_06040 [Candidatus Xenobia bacterium]|nr:hypothetical protein [Candidatus Xenobia bacterium]
MADYAYLSLWFRKFAVERGLHHLEALLQLFPQSAARPGFRLVVRSLGPEESPTLERDLIAAPADVRALASEFLHEDTAYEVTAWWDLWQPQRRQTGTSAPPGWEQAASPVEFVLEGEEYDPSREPGAREHIVATLGPEDLYLSSEQPQDDAGPRRENARRLHALLRDIQKSLPLARLVLWSEGREDFAEATRRLVSQP